jgi:gas vesicle protein
MQWELTIAVVGILTFILVWTKNLFHKKISDNKTETLKVIETKMNTVLENYKDRMQKNKREFVLLYSYNYFLNF